ncbi:PDDEXK nuclease domain-containing protein [Speluncibacter jeojiensis]|uniref:PDDEXK nuclease domain-containing protein n=1 Tax=Speluncibacter jeojiensis TaxID=2710754 RepID=UPI0024104CA1|nr:PDDEXK nuclease domain-containing protein [Rhodococcus sp. D2-41]
MAELERLGESGDLFDRVSELIDRTRTTVAAQANSALTLMNWQIGHLIDTQVLAEQRAEYARETVVALSRQLTKRYGRGFDRANLYRMRQFAQAFPDRDIVATLSRQLSWSHFIALIAVDRDTARDFYIQQALDARLSVRALRELIGRQGFERREIANAQTPGGSAVPLDTFSDPYFLDFLGLKDSYAERDLEDALIREMEAFLLEVGHGWTFVARQKRIEIDNDDFFLDLLFYSRPLHRLIAVELKIGKFKAAHEGQMKLYLKWLDRYERRSDEEAPLGLILCTETSREQIELLEMHKDGIVVAEYWTTLPPKEELQQRITQIYRAAKERVARRALGPARDSEDAE